MVAFNEIPQYEVYGISVDVKSSETKTFYVLGSSSMNEINSLMYKHGYELDEQTTLENYLDHNWVADHIIEIVNDGNMYNAPLMSLLEGYAIYNMTFDAKVEK